MSKILRFKDILKKELIYYAFDIDDNLLYMQTKIYMDHLENGKWVTVKVDTEEFARVRKDIENWRFKPGKGGDESFEEFRDWGKKGDDTFLIDFKHAVLNKDFGPSWDKFIECLVNGYLFAIITSRGHHPKNIKKAIEWLIYEYGLNNFKNLKLKNIDKNESFEDQMINNLLMYQELFGDDHEDIINEYLDLCPVYTISSPYFKKKFGDLPPEEAKRLSIRDFNKKVKNYANKIGVDAKLGFSDDDPRFVKSAIEEFTSLMKKSKNIKYTVFDTSNRGFKKIKL